MKPTLYATSIRLLVILVTTGILSAGAWSQCNPPSSPEVALCNPANNATVAYGNLPPMISVRSTPAQGAKISAMIIYDNNNNIYENTTGGINLYEFSFYNGWHHVVVNVWDSDGNLYQAKSNFYVEGLGYAPCTKPTLPAWSSAIRHGRNLSDLCHRGDGCNWPNVHYDVAVLFEWQARSDGQ